MCWKNYDYETFNQSRCWLLGLWSIWAGEEGYCVCKIKSNTVLNVLWKLLVQYYGKKVNDFNFKSINTFDILKKSIIDDSYVGGYDSMIEKNSSHIRVHRNINLILNQNSKLITIWISIMNYVSIKEVYENLSIIFMTLWL